MKFENPMQMIRFALYVLSFLFGLCAIIIGAMYPGTREPLNEASQYVLTFMTGLAALNTFEKGSGREFQGEVR